jgi:replication factor C subunit 1
LERQIACKDCRFVLRANWNRLRATTPSIWLNATARTSFVGHSRFSRVVSAPSGKTDYVVIGRDAGPTKLAKIEALKIKTLDEDGLFDMIARTIKDENQSSDQVAAPSSSSSVASLSAPVTKKPSTAAPAPKVVKSKYAPVSGLTASLGLDLWTVKYAPTSTKEIIGNKAQADRLASWLNTW